MDAQVCPKCGGPMEDGNFGVVGADDALFMPAADAGATNSWGRIRQARGCLQCGYVELYAGLYPRRAQYLISRMSQLYQALARAPQAPAKVLASQSTEFSTQDGQVLVQLMLEVQPPDRPKFSVQAYTTAPRGTEKNIKPGLAATVRYNSADTSQVVVERWGP